MVPSDEPRRALFDEYVEERRAAAIPGFSVEALPHITRYMPTAPGGEGMVMYARLPEADAVRRIRAEIVNFSRHDHALEWKVYDLDLPANLRSLLEAEGFTAHHDEVFMMRALADEVPGEAAAPAGVEIVRAGPGNNAIDDIVKLQEETWDCAFPALAAQLRKALGPDTAIYCAYLDGAPVGTGWIDFTEGSRCVSSAGPKLGPVQGPLDHAHRLDEPILLGRQDVEQ